MSGQFLTEIVEVKTQVKEKTSVELRVPRRYKVLLLNDDYTPMEFVVAVLRHFFYLSEEVATQIMLQVHVYGRGICGVFTKEIAETKVFLVNDYSQMNGHPLVCSMEPE